MNAIAADARPVDEQTRHRVLFEQARDAVLFVRPDGTIVDANPAAVAAYGYDRSALLGLRVHDLRDPAAADPLPDQLRAAAAEGILFETRHRRRDGSTFPVEVNSRAVAVDGEQLLLSVVRDLSARQRAADALRFLAEASDVLAGTLNYEETLRRVVRLAVPELADYCVLDLLLPDGTPQRVAWVHADPDGQRLLDAALHQFAPTAARPRHPVTQALVSGRPEMVPEVDDAWLERSAVSPEHLAFMRALRLRSFLTVPLVARGRSVGALTCCFTDVSGRRYAEDQLALARNLAERAALAVDNARLYRRAQEELAERKQIEAERQTFVGAVAHDLKNPLGAARGQAQLLRRRAGRTTLAPRQLAAGLESVEAAIDRAIALIDELLDAVQLRAGYPLELRPERVDLVELAARAVAEHRRTTDRHTIAVEASVPTLSGEWDAARLERVLANLVGNAIKYSPNGGAIAVRVAREEAPGGPVALLAVADQGIGIPAADLPSIFERYRRGGNVGAIGGSGIGLVGARRIVELHGGTIAVASEEGKGTTVTVRLPLRPPKGEGRGEGVAAT